MFERPEFALHKAFDKTGVSGKKNSVLSILFSLICLDAKDNPERKGFLNKILRRFLRHLTWDVPTDKEIDMIVDMVDEDPENMVMKFCSDEVAKSEFMKEFDKIREAQ